MSPHLLDTVHPHIRTAHRWVRSIGKRAGLEGVHPHMLRAGFIVAALDSGVPLRDVQIAAHVVVAFVAGN